MVSISGDKIRPLTTISLEKIDQHSELLSDYLGKDFLFVTKNNHLIGYFSVKQVLLSHHEKTAKEIVRYLHPLETVCFTGKEISPLNLYRLIGEAIALVGDKKDHIRGYIRREDLLIALFQDESQNTELLKNILTSIPMGIIILDAGRRMINFNKAALKMIKRSLQDVLNQPADHLFNRNDIERVFETGEAILNQLIIKGQMGILADYSPIMNAGGKVGGIVIVVQDLPMVENMAREIEYVKDLNADLNAVLASIYDEILVLDANGRLIRCSETITPEYWNINFKKMIGENLLRLEEKGLFHPAIIRQAVESRKRYSTVQETSEGKKVLTLCTPVFDPKGKIQRIIIALRDITETAKLKSQLDQYKKELADFKKKDLFLQKMIYRSAVMEELMVRVKKIAGFSSTVLISGESGTGKEVIAQAIHQMGVRADKPYIKLNCGAIPENLLESELFGYVEGAFTGASLNGKKGFFERADGGILFLDEIGELPLQLQVKLLRVLQEKEVIPLGSTQPIPVDVQIVAATNRNLRKMVEEGSFREDLYFRLNVIPIHVPPLRERPEDIAVLAIHFLKYFNQKYKKHFSFMPDALNMLELYDWPGNIRELQNVIERMIVVSDSETIHADLVGKLISLDHQTAPRAPLARQIMPIRQAKDKLEEELILMAMKKFKTTTRAAKALGISQSSVSRKYHRITGKNHA